MGKRYKHVVKRECDHPKLLYLSRGLFKCTLCHKVIDKNKEEGDI